MTFSVHPAASRPTSKPVLVSVVMPTFNQARFLRAAIDSVLVQKHAPIELLVFDGGSTDETVEILDYYVRIRPDVVSYVSQKDKGQSDAINRGLARARGDIVCWLNSDDVYTPDALETVVDAFRRHPEAMFAYGRGWTIDEQGKCIGDGGVLPFDAWKLIHQRNFIQQPSCFFRKSLLERVGPIDESLHYVMDWDLWIRFAAFKGVFIDEHLSGNREYGCNKTQSGKLRRWREIKRMVRRYSETPWPPVLRIYLLEALCQMSRSFLLIRPLELPLAAMFFRAMRHETSGRYADGSVEQCFKLSIANPGAHPAVALSFSPLSRYDSSLLGGPEIRFRWKSSRGGSGELSLLENGRVQRFTLPLPDAGPHGFTHFEFEGTVPGHAIAGSNSLPTRRVVAFLDDFVPCDAVAVETQEVAVHAPILTT